MMQKKILSLAVAGALGGVAASANAALYVQEDGVGHMLVVPYFTVQNGANTLINIVNTNQTTGKAVKVRFRSALDSDDIFDFQVFLSPGDVWTGSVSQAASGKAQMATTDKSCTRPSSVNQEFVTARLQATSTVSVEEQTREGYVEIFEMADIIKDAQATSTSTSDQATSLYYQTKHVNGVAPCNANVLAGVGTVASLYEDLTAPTGDLLANWTIINVPQAAAYGGGATAIKASTTTRVVYWDQNAVAVSAVNDTAAAGARLGADGSSTQVAGWSADGVLISDYGASGTFYAAANYDFPDMSTPYETATTSAAAQADALSSALMTASLTNEYLTSSTVGAATDWVISMPTRRYHVAGRGTSSDGVSTSTTGYYDPTDKLGPTGPFSNSSSKVFVEYAADGRSACVKLSSGAYKYYNREEGTPGSAPTVDVISPNTVADVPAVRLCGEVTVVGVNGASSASSVLAGHVAYTNVTFDSGYVEGWARLDLSKQSDGAASPWSGLPVIGQAFIKAVHPQVAAGTSGVFGGNWKHRLSGRNFPVDGWADTTPASAALTERR